MNPRKSWFNEACETSRSNYFKAKNAIWEKNKTGTKEEKIQCIKNMREKGKEYKHFISKVQKDYSKNLHKNLRFKKTASSGILENTKKCRELRKKGT